MIYIEKSDAIHLSTCSGAITLPDFADYNKFLNSLKAVITVQFKEMLFNFI